jgi:hypothetical protein
VDRAYDRLYFGVYGLVKKGAPLGSLPGLTLNWDVAASALAYLLYSNMRVRCILHVGALRMS